MSNKNSIMDFSAQKLFEQLKSTKEKLITEKKIMDKKDKHIYPISDIPFSIPENWEWCYLSDISIIQEGPGIRKHQYENEGVQFLTVTNILEGAVDLEKSKKYISNDEYDNKYSHFTINKGDIVTACSGASWGKSAIFNTNDKLILNTSTLRLRFYNDLGNNKYLYYLTKTTYFKKNLSSHSTGQQPNYGYSHYSKIPIPLPSIEEQKRIVSLLDRSFEVIDKAKANAEQNLKNAKELFESYLNNIFENKGKDWEERQLGEVCSLITDGKHGNCENEVNSGYFFLSAKDIRDNTLLFNNGRQITEKDFLETHQRTDLKPGDICMINTGATIGRISFAPDDSRTFRTTFQKSVAVIKPIRSLINNHYCRYLLVSDVKKLVKISSGTAVPNLLLGDLKRHKINIPKSLQEQKQIVQKLDKLSAETKNIETIYQKKITNLEELKKSILQKAFRGEL